MVDKVMEGRRSVINRIFSIIAVVLLLILVTPVHAESNTFQSLIDQTEAGETLHLPPGDYKGNVTISKPIKVIGSDQVRVIADGNRPAITIATNNVVLENLVVIDERTSQDNETLLITGNENKLSDITIETKGVGIKLIEADDNELFNITLVGNKSASIAKRENGIDLWVSNNNLIQQATISNTKDSIYIENGKGNRIINNEFSHSRYGCHLMFTENSFLEKNYSHLNVSGIMVMGTKGTKVIDNYLTENKKSVQSQGLLLYDVENAIVANNRIIDNRVGLYVESASQNEITKNELTRNFIGIQLNKAEDNDIFHNTFSMNNVQGQAEKSSNNRTNRNYWSDHTGIDTNGNGKSNLSYTVDPFYLSLTNEYPAYQLFFQAPGMVFLEQLLHTPTEQWLTDEAPLMKNPLAKHNERKRDMKLGLISIILFITSTTIIYKGVKKQ